MTNKFEDGKLKLKVESEIMMKLPFIQKLIEDGGKPFFVGGFVRDMLLGKSPKDIDIVVEKMTTEDIKFSIGKLGSLKLVGESFSVIKFKPTDSEIEFDIAAPRTETKTGVGHKGFTVVSTRDITIEQDLGRRDFTINSIAVDIQTGEILDIFNGIEDLKIPLIRMTNPATFIDDPLRILRGVQFTDRFDAQIDHHTLFAMTKHISLVKEIAGERIHDELVKAFEKGSSTSKTFKLLFSIGFHKTFGLKVNGNMHIDDTKIKTLGDFFSTIFGHSEDAPELFMKLFKGEIEVKKQMIALQKQFEMLQIVDGTKGHTSEEILPLIAAAMVKITKDAFKLGFINDDLKKVFEEMELGLIPSKITDLEITGDDVEALGLKGKPVGKALSTLFELALFKKIENKRKVLLDKLDLIVSDFTLKRLMTDIDEVGVECTDVMESIRKADLIIETMKQNKAVLIKTWKSKSKRLATLVDDYNNLIINN
jgi:tRNA nucleotidyltransferase/poly(A) polymerase